MVGWGGGYPGGLSGGVGGGGNNQKRPLPPTLRAPIHFRSPSYGTSQIRRVYTLWCLCRCLSHTTIFYEFEENNCGAPPYLGSTTLRRPETGNGNSIILRCNPGYRYKDGRKEQLLTCQDRTWTPGELDTCTRKDMLKSYTHN